MTRTQISTSVSAVTRQQADRLMEERGYSLRDVVTVSIDRFYNDVMEDNKMNRNKQMAYLERVVNTLTGGGESLKDWNGNTRAMAHDLVEFWYTNDDAENTIPEWVDNHDLEWLIDRCAVELARGLVINNHGVAIDFDAAVELMDDEIREALHDDMAPCTDQDFFDAYAQAHQDQYNEVWELAKPDPTY